MNTPLLTPGTGIKACIVPMNDGGPGPASPIAELTLPRLNPTRAAGIFGAFSPRPCGARLSSAFPLP